MKAVHLRTEHLENPLGLQTVRPVFSWHTDGGLQSAYEIIVRNGKTAVWKSGKVTTGHMLARCGYDAAPREHLTWRIRLWDENDQPGEMLQQRLELFSYSGIAQKAAFWLLTRARQTGKHQIMIPESVSKWAMMMNVSRPSLHRELKRLESEGMIAYQPPVIELLDREGLERILSTQ